MCSSLSKRVFGALRCSLRGQLICHVNWECTNRRGCRCALSLTRRRVVEGLACAGLASTAGIANAQLVLQGFEAAAAATHFGFDAAVRNSVTKANDHGSALTDWIGCPDFNANHSRLQDLPTASLAQGPSSPVRSSAARRSSAQLAHLRLQIVLLTHLGSQLDLRLQKVDVLFGVVQDALQQIA